MMNWTIDVGQTIGYGLRKIWGRAIYGLSIRILEVKFRKVNGL